MVNPGSFGRRISPQRLPRRAKDAVTPKAECAAELTDIPVELSPSLPPHADASGSDDELQAWRAQRKERFQIPWKPLSLMATLCFGIASFVLPDSVNDAVQWLLYALMGASLYAGFGRRRKVASV